MSSVTNSGMDLHCTTGVPGVCSRGTVAWPMGMARELFAGLHASGGQAPGFRNTRVFSSARQTLILLHTHTHNTAELWRLHIVIHGMYDQE